MIDISDIVVGRVREAVQAHDRKALVVKGNIQDPTSIPCTFMREMDNSTYSKSENCKGEHHAVIAYEVNTFGSPESAMAVQGVIDAEMQAMKFHRRFCKQIPNADNTLARVVARYSAIVEKGRDENGDTVYQIYRHGR